MKNILILACLTFTFCIQAQQGYVAAGGDASGTSGTASYSVAQTVYTSNKGEAGTVTQGVQQPYVISEILGMDALRQSFKASIYPNPTSNYLTLEVENSDTENLSYQLFDVNGKILQNSQLTGKKTSILMDELASAIYLLKVLSDNKEITTFKILKNN